MAKYLVQASYTAEGFRGLIKDGAAKRRDAVKKTMTAAGCKLDGLYFCFGEDDVLLLCDCPDNITVAAIVAAVSASGVVRCRTTPLLTVEETDQALAKTITYRAPGS